MSNIIIISHPHKVEKYFPQQKTRWPVGNMGLCRFVFNDLSEHQIEIVEKINIRPFCFSLEGDKKLDENGRSVFITDDDLENLRHVLKFYTQKSLNFEYRSEQIDETSKGIYIYPLDNQLNYLYMDRYQAANFDFDIRTVIGYRLASEEKDPVFFKGIPLKKKEFGFLEKIPEPNNFSIIPITESFGSKTGLLIEISHNWNLRYDLNYPGEFRVSSDIIHAKLLQFWLEKTLLRVVQDQSPLVHISSIEGFKTVEFLKDACQKAYSHVIVRNPCLYEERYHIKIYDDLSLDVPFFCFDDYKIFVSYLIKYPNIEYMEVKEPIFSQPDGIILNNKWSKFQYFQRGEIISVWNIKSF